MGHEVVRLGAGRSIRYALRDVHRGLGNVAVHRVNAEGRLLRLGTLVPVRPDGFLMYQEDGGILHSEGMPWWLFDMRPQGFLGRAYASRVASTLGLSPDVREWSDTDAIRALLIHGHDAVGNLLLGDTARDHFLAAPNPDPVVQRDKGCAYVELAQQASQGNLPGSSAGGEQPKFTVFADTPHGPRHLLVKFSTGEASDISYRLRDLLLAEHLALETLSAAGFNAARSWVHDHGERRFLEVERFDRIGSHGRRALFSLAALDAEFVGDGRSPWPTVVEALARDKVVDDPSVSVTQSLFAFGRLIGNSDMHQGNLSFVSEHGRPYSVAPAYDMLPMAFAPGAGGILTNQLPQANLHPSVQNHVWHAMIPVARSYLERLKEETGFSPGFGPCVDALEQHLVEAEHRIAKLG